MEKKVNIEGEEIDGSEGENEECDEQADQVLPQNLDSLIKQENIMDFIEQDEKFQDCEDKEYICDCGKVRIVCFLKNSKQKTILLYYSVICFLYSSVLIYVANLF